MRRGSYMTKDFALLEEQARMAFDEAYPAHLYSVEYSTDVSVSTGSMGVVVKIVRRADDHSWKCLVLRKTDIKILVEKGKVRLDE